MKQLSVSCIIQPIIHCAEGTWHHSMLKAELLLSIMHHDYGISSHRVRNYSDCTNLRVQSEGGYYISSLTLLVLSAFNTHAMQVQLLFVHAVWVYTIQGGKF